MPRAAPSREAPSASQDLEAGAVLKLGEYADQPTLNTSEARIILKKTLDARRARNHNAEETETLAKTRDYLELFAVFKEIEEAQQVESIIDTYAKDIARFEKSQLGESTCWRCIQPKGYKC
jgi:DNA-directed RNA polymerase II subunit RPB4